MDALFIPKLSASPYGSSKLAPLANPGIFPDTNCLTRYGFLATDLAGIMASPLDTIAKIESDVPVPGPEIIPPLAYFLIGPLGVIGTLKPLCAATERS